MKRGLAILAGLLALAGSAGVYAGSDGAEHASAVLKNPAGEVIGEARFVEDATGLVHVNVHVNGIYARSGLHWPVRNRDGQLAH